MLGKMNACTYRSIPVVWMTEGCYAPLKPGVEVIAAWSDRLAKTKERICPLFQGYGPGEAIQMTVTVKEQRPRADGSWRVVEISHLDKWGRRQGTIDKTFDDRSHEFKVTHLLLYLETG